MRVFGRLLHVSYESHRKINLITVALDLVKSLPSHAFFLLKMQFVAGCMQQTCTC